MIWLALTISVFLLARLVAKRFSSPLTNPLILSVASIAVLLTVFDIPYSDYNQGNQLLNLLLGPAVVALAIPLHEQFHIIKSNARLILITCTLGSIASMFSSGIVLLLMNASEEMLASMIGKSVTTAIAMEVSKTLGGIPAITAIFVVLAGLTGALFAYPIFTLFSINNPIARGLSMGTASHALGTATSFQQNTTDGVYSSVALVLCGVITSILAPVCTALLLAI